MTLACPSPPQPSITPLTILAGSILLAARAIPMMSVVRRLASWRISGSTPPSRAPAANLDTSCNRVVIAAPAPAGAPGSLSRHDLERREDEHELVHTGRRKP